MRSGTSREVVPRCVRVLTFHDSLACRVPHSFAANSMSTLPPIAMTPRARTPSLRACVHTQISAGAFAAKVGEGCGHWPLSKGARFIARAPRSVGCIQTAKARSRASEQGRRRMTSGASSWQMAASAPVRRLIRCAGSVGERGPGQGGDPPVAAKHVRHYLPAVHASFARPLVGGAAGVFERAGACSGMAKERSY